MYTYDVVGVNPVEEVYVVAGVCRYGELVAG